MVRIVEARDYEIPGYKQAVFEDGTTSLAPASVVSSLMAEQDKRESFAVPESVKRAQAEQAGSLLASNAPSDQPVLFSDPSISRPPQNEPSVSDASVSFAPAPQMSMERQAPRPQPAMDGGPTMTPEAPQQGAAPTDLQNGAQLYDYAIQQAMRPRVVGGRAAFDPKAYDASLAPVRQSMTEQTSGGRYYDPEAQQRINEAEFAARQVQAQTAIDRAQEMEARAASERLDAETEYDDKLAAQQAAEREHATRMGELNKQAQDIAAQKPDAKRYLNDMGADKKIAFIIAAALTGYATRGQGIAPMIANFNELTQRDIDSQWKEIENKRSLTDNALGRMAQQYGSIQEGRKALEILQRKAFLARAERFAAGVATKDAFDAYKNLETMMAPEIMKREEELKAASVGSVSRAVNSAYTAPQAARAGSYQGPDVEKALKLLGMKQEYVSKGMANEAKQIDNDFLKQNGMTLEQAAKQGEQNSKDVQEYGKRFDAVAAGKSAIDKVISENDIKTNDKGDLVAPADLAGFGSMGGSSAPAAIVSDKGMANRAALNSIVAAVAIKRFGAYNPVQGDAIREEIIGNGSARTITTNLGVIRRELESARENMKASFSPNVHQQYERNLAASRRGEDKLKAFKPVEGL